MRIGPAKRVLPPKLRNIGATARTFAFVGVAEVGGLEIHGVLRGGGGKNGHLGGRPWFGDDAAAGLYRNFRDLFELQLDLAFVVVMSMVTLPPPDSRPNSSSSARAERMVSWIRRAIGRAPISGSKPFSAEPFLGLSVEQWASTFFSWSWASSCIRNLSTTRRMISGSRALEGDGGIEAVAELWARTGA